ncbi:hypothetical protein COEREDRAFT_84320 [Coemansia reversa NRRL 1564]|uniref:Uncharacterized protein n=1 Tax=Coemansia reversa (strain ATCC 12441 / NRRL 1564) TaxID=763665 RepID=A0A2G5BL26_COERN|nr:hypothetical protein COEREDRAFT_84320 [Coemansia reversa NRRL 1564]|eukprot:PIA19706.1 hypothetical protein COEREDRAFT_84320 [Coemansia reversa NRRL 1564]
MSKPQKGKLTLEELKQMLISGGDDIEALKYEEKFDDDKWVSNGTDVVEVASGIPAGFSPCRVFYFWFNPPGLDFEEVNPEQTSENTNTSAEGRIRICTAKIEAIDEILKYDILSERFREKLETQKASYENIRDSFMNILQARSYLKRNSQQ